MAKGPKKVKVKAPEKSGAPDPPNVEPITVDPPQSEGQTTSEPPLVEALKAKLAKEVVSNAENLQGVIPGMCALIAPTYYVCDSDFALDPHPCHSVNSRPPHHGPSCSS